MLTPWPFLGYEVKWLKPLLATSVSNTHQEMSLSILALNSAEKTRNIAELQKVADSPLDVNVTEAGDVTLGGGKLAHHDEAFEILASTQGVRYVTEDENARILKKIDWQYVRIFQSSPP